MRRAWYALMLIAVSAVLSSCRPPRVASAPNPPPTGVASRVTETRLAPWPTHDPNHPRSVVSPDGLHVAWIARRGLGYALVYDGRPGPRWDAIGGVMESQGCIGYEVCGKFSEDSLHFTYWGRRGRLWHLVLDGRPGPGCPGDQRSAPSFTGPVNGHYAVRVQGREEAYWIIDGREQPRYSSLYGQFQFSPDGLHYAYVAGTPQGCVIIRDGRTIYPNSKFGPPAHVAFSPDGKRLAYVTETVTSGGGGVPDTPQIVIEGEASFVGHASAQVTALAFSPDSTNLAWVEMFRTGKAGRT